MKPKLLVLFCGAGGGSEGYSRAGFDVSGVDLYPMPRYPFPFTQDDAMTFPLDEGYDALHASPPCQAYSWSAKRWTDIPRADLVGDTRTRLQATGLPYVIENVIGSPLRNPIRLCGEMFGLGVIRHRLFESNIPLIGPEHPAHRGTVRDGTYVTVAGHGGDNIKGHGSRAEKQRAMGIDWMNDKELNESIPPAYLEYVGAQLLAATVRLVDPVTFAVAVAKVRAVELNTKRQVGEYLSHYSVAEYADMRCFLTEDRLSGYAIASGPELVSLFNVGPAGRGDYLVEHAIKIGGAERLDTFDENGVIPSLYKRHGFREVKRIAWDDAYAPDGWTGARPDVVYMEIV